MLKKDKVREKTVFASLSIRATLQVLPSEPDTAAKL
nr:MAG TPA: hypothetical protein [Bacteriophage sp.]